MSSDENSNQHSMISWVFALATFSLLTIVLIVTPFLSADAKHSISYEVVYWYELGLMVFAVIAMVAMEVWARCNGTKCICTCDDPPVNEEENTSCLSNVFWAMFQGVAKCIEPASIFICGVGSVFLPSFVILSTFSCVDMENNRMYNVRIAYLVFTIVFSIVETVWLLGFQRLTEFIDVTKFLHSTAIMLIILGNLVLCVRSILDTVRASTTRAYENINASLPQHFFDVTLVFSKCSNNTEIADSGAILYVYRFTYSFPFLLGFLALKLIFSVLFNNKKPSSVNDSSEMCKQNAFHRCIKKCVSSLLPCISKLSELSHIVSPIAVIVLSVPYTILEALSGTFWNSDESATKADYTYALYIVSLVYTYIYAAVPTCTYFGLRKYKVKSNLDFNKCLLIFCAVGHIFLCLFEVVDSFALLIHPSDKSTYEFFYMAGLVFRRFGIFFQMIVIIDSHGFLKRETIVENKQLLSIVRGVLIFLAYDNGIRWLIETILPAPALQQVYQIKKDDLFGERNWWLVVKLFTPIVLLYRLLASVMCFKLAAKMK